MWAPGAAKALVTWQTPHPSQQPGSPSMWTGMTRGLIWAT